MAESPGDRGQGWQFRELGVLDTTGYLKGCKREPGGTVRWIQTSF